MAAAGLVSAAKAAGAAARASGGDGRNARAWAGVLAEIPLFAHVSGRQIRKIASLGSIVRFEAGTTIVRAGDDGDAFYVVLDGRGAVVRRRLPEVKIGAGAYFGEMALLDGGPRSATVAARTEMTCFRLGRAAFQKMLRGEPAVSAAMLRVLAERIRKLQEGPTD